MNDRHINTRRMRRHRRVRAVVQGTAQRPRLSVFRSHRNIAAQLIDDDAETTLAAASSAELPVGKTRETKTQKAAAVGSLLAERARAAKITRAVFDRGGYRYHGRVKALAEAVRHDGMIM